MVQTVKTDQVEMDYFTFGNGRQDLVILPGLSLRSVMNSEDAVASAYSQFGREYRITLFDRRKDLPEDYSVSEMAEDTAKAIMALGIENACLFGTSQGGMIAMLIAIRYPHLVKKLALGSAAAEMNGTAKEVLSGWISLAEKRDAEGLVNSMIDRIYSEDTLSLYRDALLQANADPTEEELSRFVILAKAAADFSCYEELAKITCPVFVIGSEGDRVLTGEASLKIAKKLNCPVFLYGDSFGHAVYDEAPDYKNRLQDFFKD